MYVSELTVRYRSRRLATPTIPIDTLSTAAEAAAAFQALIAFEIVEVVGLICLTTTLKPIAYYEVARGTLDMAIVVPRDVLRVALLCNCGALLIGHNHPSGSIQPSAADRHLTVRLRAACELVGLPLYDHLIVNRCGNYFSFKEASLI